MIPVISTCALGTMDNTRVSGPAIPPLAPLSTRAPWVDWIWFS